MLPVTTFERVAIGLVIALVTHLGAYSFGWFKGYSSSEVRWNEQKKALIAQAEARAEALKAEGSRLSAELEVAKANVRIEYVEVIREIRKSASSVRRAFDADLAGMLNALSGIRETSERVDSSGVVETRRETATNSPRSASEGVSERALAEWIAGSIKAHEECRVQANALIEYAKACSR